MSKRVATRWYIRASVVWFIASGGALLLTRVVHDGPSSATLIAAYVVMAASGAIALAMWIATLVRLAQQCAWEWFTAVLVLHLAGLGIIGMAAYAAAGPRDTDRVAVRPATT